MLVHRSLQVSARSVRPRTNAVTCSAGNGPSTSQSEQQILSRRQLLSTLGAGVAAFGFVRRVDAAQSRIAG